MNRLRAFATRFFTPVADRLLAAGVSPDAVTVTGTLVVVAAALGLLGTGRLLAGGLVILVFVLTDALDGVMARRAGRSGPWGAFLDSTLDRVADAAIFAGLAWWLAGTGGDAGSALGLAGALAALVTGQLVSYARARAEGLGMTASGGIAERADRLVVVLAAVIAVGAGAPVAVLVVALWLLTAASAVTVGQRVAAVRRQTRAAA